MARPAPSVPLSRRALLVRIALYGVSFWLWLFFALVDRHRGARIGCACACVLIVVLMAVQVRRYRRLTRPGAPVPRE
jgi:hypothetical protein